jgi:hypothetical protein
MIGGLFYFALAKKIPLQWGEVRKLLKNFSRASVKTCLSFNEPDTLQFSQAPWE